MVDKSVAYRSRYESRERERLSIRGIIVSMLLFNICMVRKIKLLFGSWQCKEIFSGLLRRMYVPSLIINSYLKS